METRQYSFIDIFKTSFDSENGPVKLEKIAIPIIQRDYAQGRRDPEVDRIRKRFLESLYKAVTEEPITLDFVYGDINDEGTMTPLDGQQRLTTLFLLHWYAAKRGGVSEAKHEFLKGFSYETRYSARYFCSELIGFDPSFNGLLSREIINQAWFPLEWKKDPTISSMLVMLDDIDAQFKDVDNLWEQLKNNAITFYFLPIRDMGLTDELYIKMNSRGKPLTQFEHFKAELEREIRQIDVRLADRIIRKIDLDWTDMLWEYRDSGMGTDEDNIIDDEFLRYFKFICDVICYHEGNSPRELSTNEFDLLQRYFSAENENALDNILLLESYFDIWCSPGGYKNPNVFLNTFMAGEHTPGKIIVDKNNKIDIFEDCLHSYSDHTGRLRLFPLNRFILLYAFVSYLLNKERIDEVAFARRLRIVNNLIRNSEDEVSDRADSNRIPAILKQVDAIILTGEIDDTIEKGFNVNQIEEEKAKIDWLLMHPDQEEELYELEDHPRLYGQISIIGLDNIGYASRFESLFNCSLDLIDCALMATGDYGQTGRNGWRHQYGSSRMLTAWDNLFHKSANTGFEKTHEVLIKLLSQQEVFTDEILKEIKNDFIAQCENESLFPWRYYYVNYDVCRPGKYGKCYIRKEDAPYGFVIMKTRLYLSSHSYVPYFILVDEAHLSHRSCGLSLIYDDIYIQSGRSSFEIYRNEDDEEIGEIPVPQNEDGIDIENRVTVLEDYLKKEGLI